MDRCSGKTATAVSTPAYLAGALNGHASVTTSSGKYFSTNFTGTPLTIYAVLRINQSIGTDGNYGLMGGNMPGGSTYAAFEAKADDATAPYPDYSNIMYSANSTGTSTAVAHVKQPLERNGTSGGQFWMYSAQGTVKLGQHHRHSYHRPKLWHGNFRRRLGIVPIGHGGGARRGLL